MTGERLSLPRAPGRIIVFPHRTLRPGGILVPRHGFVGIAGCCLSGTVFDIEQACRRQVLTIAIKRSSYCFSPPKEDLMTT